MSKFYRKTAFLVIGILVLETLSIAIDKNSFMADYFSGSIISTNHIVALTNASRKKVGVRPLAISRALKRAAQKKAKDMLKKQYFSHVSPFKKTPWDFMKEVRYDYLFAGENLAINFKSAEAVTKGWLMSESHKDNLLSKDYSEMGVGIAKGIFQGEKTTIVVLMFGRPFLPNNMIISRPPSVSVFSSASFFDLFPGMRESYSLKAYGNIFLLSIALFCCVLFLFFRSSKFFHPFHRLRSRKRIPHRIR